MAKRTAKNSAARRIKAGNISKLSGNLGVKFSLNKGDFPLEGFVVRTSEGVRAYINRCPHAGTTLDFGDNEFFTEDGRFLLCKTHGALFEPNTGACAGGPCAGRGLEPLEIDVTPAGSVLVKIPQKKSEEERI